jgi:acylphosphatase
MEGMADHTAFTATVTGRVQGVGYRYAVMDVAQELGLVGWVRNAQDGSVETWAKGDGLLLEQFIAFLRQGPRLAMVHSVDIHSVDPDASLRGFALRF